MIKLILGDVNWGGIVHVSRKGRHTDGDTEGVREHGGICPTQGIDASAERMGGYQRVSEEELGREQGPVG